MTQIKSMPGVNSEHESKQFKNEQDTIRELLMY